MALGNLVQLMYEKYDEKKQDKTGEKAKMGVDSLLNTPDTKCDSTLAST